MAEKITETEFAILDVLWEHGPMTVRAIVEEVYDEHTPILHASVRSLLDRLAQKGFVAGDDSTPVRLFETRVDRGTFLGSQLQRLADSHFRGSLVPMLQSMVERVNLSDRDRAAILRIISKIE